MVSLPLSCHCSRVSTVTGAGVVRSLRRTREPVTTISSCMFLRDCSAAGGGADVGVGGGLSSPDGDAGCCARARGLASKRDEATVAARNLQVIVMKPPPRRVVSLYRLPHSLVHLVQWRGILAVLSRPARARRWDRGAAAATAQPGQGITGRRGRARWRRRRARPARAPSRRAARSEERRVGKSV